MFTLTNKGCLAIPALETPTLANETGSKPHSNQNLPIGALIMQIILITNSELQNFQASPFQEQPL